MRKATIVMSVVFVAVQQAQAVEIGPTQQEMQTKAHWLKQRLLETRFEPAPAKPAEPAEAQPGRPAPGLFVLANHDPVQLNARGGKPLKLNNKECTRGLYCHAVSKVVVRLPEQGKSFSAVVGVDSNRDTVGGRGSVVFSVSVRDKTVFQSEVMRENTPPREVNVDLGGADTFILEVDDAGNGIACDQADWANAKVTLASGKELWLGDMPLSEGAVVPHMPLLPRSGDLPFSFEYDGKPSDSLLAHWPKKTETKRIDQARTQHTFVWTDPKTALEIRCTAVEYADFPVVEWTAYFKNTGRENTPILQNIQALDAQIERGPEGEFLLRHWKGDTCKADLYEPLELPLGPNATQRFAPAGGRGSNGTFPYYNLVTPGGGLMLAVGWPGQWATTFTRDAQRGLRITAGQELTRMTLKPGQQIRTPLVALFFWQGTDTVRAQNLWRRWMWAHNVPRTADGRLPPPILFGNTSLEFNEMCNANEENQKYFIDRYLEERVKLDFWWMDAGWYPCGGKWPNTGTWEPDTARFPKGLRAISDHAHTKNVKTLVWFEPERVANGTWLAQNHPEWLLRGKLLDLGNPAAQEWLTDHVDRVLREQGISLYRQDFNMDPLSFWRAADAPDRLGVTENLHVQGYLAYWDELRRRHPQLVIDSCASGGRRNDLETMRRAVALHPTDYNYTNLTVKQAFHYSLFQWTPYFGSNTLPIDTIDAYAVRSGYGMALILGYDLRRKDLNYDLLRKLTAQWRQVVPHYSGDFYPLTPYNVNEGEWIAWQFHRPDQEAGVVEAFRRPKSAESAKVLRLGGLDPAAQYAITDLDTNKVATIAGRDLMEKGLRVEIKTQPAAATITYKKAN